MGKRLVVFLAFVAGLLTAANANADILDITGVGLDDNLLSVIAEAERRITNSVANDYSDELPRFILEQAKKIEITAQLDPDADGVGGVLASATTDIWLDTGAGTALAQEGSLFIDEEDFAILSRESQISIVMHEVFHAMGFSGDGFGRNELVVNDFQYVGVEGVMGFRRDSGLQFASFVPLEQTGGAGTAGSHWAENTPGLQGPGFQDVMIGFFDETNNIIISEATIGAMRDLHFTITQDGFVQSPFADAFWKNPPSGLVEEGNGEMLVTLGSNITAVPEPTSVTLLAFGVVGFALRRRRS